MASCLINDLKLENKFINLNLEDKNYQEKISNLNSKLDKLKCQDPEAFIYEYYYNIRNSIDICVETKIIELVNNQNELDQIKFNRDSLIENLKELEETCLNKLRSKTEADIINERLKLKIEEFKKSISDLEFSRDEFKLDKVDYYVQIEYMKYQCFCLAGYFVENIKDLCKNIYNKSNFNYTCSFDYKIVDENDNLSEINQEQAELIYYFENQASEVTLDKLNSSTCLHYIFSKLYDQKMAFDLLVLYCKLNIDKPKDIDLSMINFTTNNERQHRYVVKDLENDYCIKICMGLILEKFDLNRNNVKNSLFNKILFIVSHRKNFTARLRHHVLMVVEKYCRFFSKKQWQKIHKWDDIDMDAVWDQKVECDYLERLANKSEYYYDDDDDSDYLCGGYSS